MPNSMPISQQQTAYSGNTMWLDPSQLVTMTDLVQVSGFTEHDILDFVDIGILVPVTAATNPPAFSAACVMTVRKAGQLKADLDLDQNAAVLVMTLLEQIRLLEQAMARLSARLPVFRRM